MFNIVLFHPKQILHIQLLILRGTLPKDRYTLTGSCITDRYFLFCSFICQVVAKIFLVTVTGCFILHLNIMTHECNLIDLLYFLLYLNIFLLLSDIPTHQCLAISLSIDEGEITHQYKFHINWFHNSYMLQ